jgi:hypothetical protein
MDERKRADKFRVGQFAILVLTKETGWEPLNGEQCVIVAGRHPITAMTVDMQLRPVNFVRGEEMYEVRCGKWRLAVVESYLRPIDDRQELSTWAEFAKVTGLDLPGSYLVAKPVRRKRRTATTNGAG